MNPAERAKLAEDVAVRVVELLRKDMGPTGPKPLTVAQVADMLGYSHDWVRDHRHKLGVLPAEGKRPRLMFDAERVRAFMRAPEPEPEVHHNVSKLSRRNRSDSADLLPIRGAA